MSDASKDVMTKIETKEYKKSADGKHRHAQSKIKLQEQKKKEAAEKKALEEEKKLAVEEADERLRAAKQKAEAKVHKQLKAEEAKKAATAKATLTAASASAAAAAPMDGLTKGDFEEKVADGVYKRLLHLPVFKTHPDAAKAFADADDQASITTASASAHYATTVAKKEDETDKEAYEAMGDKVLKNLESVRHKAENVITKIGKKANDKADQQLNNINKMDFAGDVAS